MAQKIVATTNRATNPKTGARTLQNPITMTNHTTIPQTSPDKPTEKPRYAPMDKPIDKSRPNIHNKTDNVQTK